MPVRNSLRVSLELLRHHALFLVFPLTFGQLMETNGYTMIFGSSFWWMPRVDICQWVPFVVAGLQKRCESKMRSLQLLRPDFVRKPYLPLGDWFKITFHDASATSG